MGEPSFGDVKNACSYSDHGPLASPHSPHNQAPHMQASASHLTSVDFRSPVALWHSAHIVSDTRTLPAMPSQGPRTIRWVNGESPGIPSAESGIGRRSLRLHAISLHGDTQDARLPYASALNSMCASSALMQPLIICIVSL